MSLCYEDELNVFLKNIQTAAKTFYVYACFLDLHKKDPKKVLLIQTDAYFWGLYIHTSLVTIFIYLSKNFDKPRSAHKLSNLMEIIKKDNILNQNELGELQKKIDLAEEEWNKIKSIRDAIIVHDERNRDPNKPPVPDKIEHEILRTIIDELLWVADFLRNKALPDNHYDFTLRPVSIKSKAKEEMKKLLDRLYCNDQ